MIDFKNISRSTVYSIIFFIVGNIVLHYFMEDARFYIVITVLVILGLVALVYKENKKLKG